MLQPNTTTYDVGGLFTQTSYTFRVRAAGPGGFSSYSNEATGTTFPVGLRGH